MIALQNKNLSSFLLVTWYFPEIWKSEVKNLTFISFVPLYEVEPLIIGRICEGGNKGSCPKYENF